MSTLHIVNKTGQPLSLCLRSLGPDDGIIFIEDGVYNLLGVARHSHKVFALQDDCLARGVEPGDKGIDAISMDQFVELTEQYSKTLSWF